MKKSTKIALTALVIIIILCSASFIVCYAMGVFDKNDHETWFEEAKNGGIDYKAAQEIKVGMTLEEIVEMIGKPQRDVGSGTFLMEWDIKSGEVLLVSFNPSVSEDNNCTCPITFPPDLDLVSFHVEIKG